MYAVREPSPWGTTLMDGMPVLSPSRGMASASRMTTAGAPNAMGRRHRRSPYAAKLRLAGVPVTTVRYDGTCHDFMLLNALSQTRATRAAIAQATAFLREGLGTD